MFLPAGEDSGYEAASRMDEALLLFSKGENLVSVLIDSVGWVGGWSVTHCFAAGSRKEC